MDRNARALALLTMEIAIAAGGCAAPAMRAAGSDQTADRAAIVAAVQAQNDESRRAWVARDARSMFHETPDSMVVRTPDGRTITKTDMIADLQRRMDMTLRVDTMQVRVDSIRFAGPNEAIVWSSQRFVREMRVPGQVARVRISSVLHEQRFRKGPEGWRSEGPVQEHDPRARWVDEPPPP